MFKISGFYYCKLMGLGPLVEFRWIRNCRPKVNPSQFHSLPRFKEVFKDYTILFSECCMKHSCQESKLSWRDSYTVTTAKQLICALTAVASFTPFSVPLSLAALLLACFQGNPPTPLVYHCRLPFFWEYYVPITNRELARMIDNKWYQWMSMNW